MLVVSPKLASPAFASPEPPSLAVQVIVTSLLCQTPSAEPQLTDGLFLSTLLPPSGPITVEWPTPSISVFESVCAFAVSVPAGTLVDSEKLESLAGVRPDPPSAPVQARVTSVADQVDDAGSHEYVGAFLSILNPPTGPAVALFPTTSE